MPEISTAPADVELMAKTMENAQEIMGLGNGYKVATMLRALLAERERWVNAESAAVARQIAADSEAQGMAQQLAEIRETWAETIRKERAAAFEEAADEGAKRARSAGTDDASGELWNFVGRLRWLAADARQERSLDAETSKQLQPGISEETKKEIERLGRNTGRG